jgi:hypothetical protein
MHRPAPPRTAAGLAGATALVALVGAWTGHTLEYVRVAGGAGLAGSLLSGAHAYMLPVGALLALTAALCGARCRRAWLLLGRRLDRLHAALRGALRGRVPTAPSASPPVSPPARLIALWLPLGAAQIALYLVQENLEAAFAGAPAPGLGPVLGVHAGAAAVQMGVALVLAAVLLLGARLLARRALSVERCERLLRVLRDRLVTGPRTPGRARAFDPAPVERFGRQLWSRPPPVLL